MFFFNGRIRNAHIIPMVTSNRPSTNKISYSGIILGCLSIVIGLILIAIGLISQTKKTTFFSIGSISLSFGFFVITFAWFYTKLNICYHNWAYGSHIAPYHVEHTQLATAGDISISCFTGTTAVAQKAPTRTSLSPQKPVKMLSDVRVKKVRIAPLTEIDRTLTNTIK